MRGRILIIEDDKDLAKSVGELLSLNDYEVEVCHSSQEGRRKGCEGSFDVVMTDFNMPDSDGLEVLDAIHEVKPLLPVIVITGMGTTETAIESTKRGAFDYLVKPVNPKDLLSSVAKGVEHYRIVSKPVAIEPLEPIGEMMVGNSPAMQNVYKEIGRVARMPVSVMICGETGTGKEMVARAIYSHSNRAGKAFVAVNCAAIPETLLESELFGHEKGAFTGANMRRIGRFEQANGGTIFLDEIGELSPSTQAKLLRVLQEKSVQRLGGKDTIPIDVRLITATHRDMQKGLEEGDVREDFYFRVSVTVIQLPRLKDRKEDIPLLVDYFLKKYRLDLGMAGISIQPEAVTLLQSQKWPGNVRQLENTVRKAMIEARGHVITPRVIEEVLESEGIGKKGKSALDIEGYVHELADEAEQGLKNDVYNTFTEKMEEKLFRVILKRTRGNKKKAAEWLGMSRTTLRTKLKKYGMDSED